MVSFSHRNFWLCSFFRGNVEVTSMGLAGMIKIRKGLAGMTITRKGLASMTGIPHSLVKWWNTLSVSITLQLATM